MCVDAGCGRSCYVGVWVRVCGVGVCGCVCVGVCVGMCGCVRVFSQGGNNCGKFICDKTAMYHGHGDAYIFMHLVINSCGRYITLARHISTHMW